MGEGKVKKIAAISLISVFLMSGCAVHNDETSIGKFGLAYKSNIQRKLDNQYYTEAEASLARGRISGAENIVKNDATHFCVTQGKKMQIVDLKTEGAGLNVESENRFKTTMHIFILSVMGYSSTPLLNVSNNDKQIDETKAEFLFYAAIRK